MFQNHHPPTPTLVHALTFPLTPRLRNLERRIFLKSPIKYRICIHSWIGCHLCPPLQLSHPQTKVATSLREETSEISDEKSNPQSDRLTPNFYSHSQFSGVDAPELSTWTSSVERRMEELVKAAFGNRMASFSDFWTPQVAQLPEDGIPDQELNLHSESELDGRSSVSTLGPDSPLEKAVASSIEVPAQPSLRLPSASQFDVHPGNLDDIRCIVQNVLENE
ncbi:hypothetical protein L218DRAFT_653498 [Marasmius fiardii PR-910]|nr:hypothetical protein L218DRAFT_653498 [Marasmius fiardii PR-910]